MNTQRSRTALLSCLILFGTITQSAAGQQASDSPKEQIDPATAKEMHDAALLYAAHKALEGLPLFEDLCTKFPNSGVVAEWHGAGLIAKADTLSDEGERKSTFDKAVAEIRRARALGNNSRYVQVILDIQDKSTVPLAESGRYVTVGYSYGGKPKAQAVFKEAEVHFQQRDLVAAGNLYMKAAAIDPAWYAAALYAGDAFFALKDTVHAAYWFQKAIAIDPDRETAYRYWGDAIAQTGDRAGAKQKYELAFVAEPYGKTTLLALQNWAKGAHSTVGAPKIFRPEFTVANGALVPDAALASRTADGRASWLVYEQGRVSRKAESLNQTKIPGYDDGKGTFHITGYRHSLAEENASIAAMLADVQAKLDSGAVTAAGLDPSLATLLKLQHDGFLNCWILLNASDAGLRADFPAYRAEHRDVLVDYVERYMIASAAPTTTSQ